MLRITLLTKHSVFFVFLISNTVNPLLASAAQPISIVKNRQQRSSLYQDIINLLIQRGLDENVAVKKVKNLFKDSKTTSDNLSHLYNYPELFISKEKIDETLANYALHEKSFSASSYTSLIGLSQNILLQPLSNEQLDTVKHITSLSHKTS